MSERKPYHRALQEAAHHVVAGILAPETPLRPAVLAPDDAGPEADVLTAHTTDGAVRVEALARFAGPAAVRLGARIYQVDEQGDAARARALLASLGEDDREDVYLREAEGFVRVHFLTIRALALQLLQAKRLDAAEVELIVGVAEGRTPRSALEAYREAAAAGSNEG